MIGVIGVVESLNLKTLSKHFSNKRHKTRIKASFFTITTITTNNEAKPQKPLSFAWLYRSITLTSNNTGWTSFCFQQRHVLRLATTALAKTVVINNNHPSPTNNHSQASLGSFPSPYTLIPNQKGFKPF